MLARKSRRTFIAELLRSKETLDAQGSAIPLPVRTVELGLNSPERPKAHIQDLGVSRPEHLPQLELVTDHF
jgi:hypothetical protein